MGHVIYNRLTTPAFHPDTHHRTVQAVLRDPKLSADEKRVILSAWASDMYAVESAPTLRMIPGHPAPLRLSDIIGALRDLDDDPPPRGGAAARIPARNESSGPDAVSPPAGRLARLRHEADLRTARMRAHRDNIRRYKRILTTSLTDLERQFVKRRLAEEQSAIRALANAKGDANARLSLAAGC